MSHRILTGLIVAVLAVVPAVGLAQAPEYGPASGLGRHVSAGGELTAVLGPRDETAFFNYSDYERNIMRMARLRLFGEWRAASRVSAIVEVRTENDDVMLPALYVRWQPIGARDFFVQAGRIPPVTGGFSRHAYGRDNIVIGQPLAYQYLTSLRPDAVPATPDDLLRMRGRGWQPSFPIGSAAIATGIPLVSASRWDTGVSGFWRHDRFGAAVALTRGSPAVPVVEDLNGSVMWSGRVSAHLPRGVTVGLSAARGQWLDNSVLDLTPTGRDTPASQSLIGTDVEFGHGPWLVRGELMRAAFETPVVRTEGPNATLDAWSGFVEARYRPFPRWQFGARLDRLAFGELPGSPHTTWDADVDRVEAVVGFRVNRRIEVRAGWQHNWRDGGRVREKGLPLLAVIGWF